jgi:hypothetical protein
MTRSVAVWIAFLLVVQPALAVLPPGKPAGVRTAQTWSNPAVFVGAIVLLGVGIGLTFTTYDNPAAPPSTQP